MRSKVLGANFETRSSFIMNGVSLICYKHCNDKSIFCKEVPIACPLCKTVVTRYVLEPFRIPCPFAEASGNPCALVVKPSFGNFLQDYKPTDDLHIGLTNSVGRIFEFDARGLTINDLTKWKNCLVINTSVPESWYSRWDEVLEELCTGSNWNLVNYNPTSYNCFDFVMNFLTLLNYKDLTFLDKTTLCSSFVLPKLRDVLRYVSLYRNLQSNEYYVSA
ncbi:MKRN2 opposite strand protein [Venturia canescens]|uniref:MKRN2 opposite strand protein n=1 Tax=Venturia canescens TaxID=32260 RepID=UPI001C9CC25E|nr:MKRN2 opposite strand protein [Venturia canescens]